MNYKIKNLYRPTLDVYFSFLSKKSLQKIYFALFLHSFKKDELVAQLVEQYTFNVWALGSSPSQFTVASETSEAFLIYALCLYHFLESQPVHRLFQK